MATCPSPFFPPFILFLFPFPFYPSFFPARRMAQNFRRFLFFFSFPVPPPQHWEKLVDYDFKRSRNLLPFPFLPWPLFFVRGDAKEQSLALKCARHFSFFSDSFPFSFLENPFLLPVEAGFSPFFFFSVRPFFPKERQRGRR